MPRARIRRIFTIQAMALLVLLGVAGVQSARADLLVNGSFDATPILKYNGFDYFTSIPGWSIDATRSTGTVFELQDARSYGNSYNGINHAELDSNGSTFIYQDVTTTVGTDYSLTYAFSARPQLACNATQGCYPTEVPGMDNIVEDQNQNHIGVFEGTAGGPLNMIDDHTASGVGLYNTVWTVYTVSFTATSTDTRIEFGDLGISDNYGTFLDGVSLVSGSGPPPGVPEPGTMGLLATGLAGFVIVRFRRSV